MAEKIRIDRLLYEKGLAPSRERAQALIMAGNVLINEAKVEKSGLKVAEDSQIRILGLDQPFVSRGGLKLSGALELFDVSVKNKLAMDIGASTGGFTDCLLQNGACYVFAVDSGFNQLEWNLRNHPKVRNLEKTNFRHLEMTSVGSYVDLIVIDVSFISLRKILPNCLNFLSKGGDLIALIKPQFEAGKKRIQKGGLIKDPKIHEEVKKSIIDFAADLGLVTKAIDNSPIQGKKSGNQEFLIHLIRQ